MKTILKGQKLKAESKMNGENSKNVKRTQVEFGAVALL